ncbi:MAG: hypothetical protein GIW95_01475 [Candidatus Eremiobacteraeota bacterium]|nr:hypothetical protein [Candidatus Eremiobacteraeota bacterium]
MSEATTSGYTLIEAPRPKQRLVHVHADPNELGRVYAADVAILSNPANFAETLDLTLPVANASLRWTDWAKSAHDDYERNREWTVPRGALDMAGVVRHLDDVLPEDAIVCNGAGNFAAWVHRYYRYKRFGTQLAPASGAMGYGVPAAVAAKLRHPERIVLAFSGDGCFLMSGQELATAMQYGVAPVFIIVNNGMYGTIRMHQEREYPGRTIATDILNPDFVAYAHAFGAHAEAVERTEDFPAAFERASNAGRAAVLELRVDPDAISPRTTITEMRAKARAAN